MSNQIKVRAEKYKFKYEIKHYSYENAGHQFDDLPFIPQIDFSNISTWKSGGNFQGNALASIDSWNRVFMFLNKQLGNMELNKSKADNTVYNLLLVLAYLPKSSRILYSVCIC